MAISHDPTDLSGDLPGRPTRPAPPPPVMAPPPGAQPAPVGPPVPPAAAPTLTWEEQETLAGLRRLARAQAQLVAAEGEAPEPTRPFDPVAVAELERVHGQLAEARVRASGRFAKGSTRNRVRELELAERQVLDHLKMATYEDYRARAAGARSATAADPDVVAFARRELEAAERGWQELRELEVPSTTPDIDLTSGSRVVRPEPESEAVRSSSA
jgi:hypothetical protein